MKLSPPVPPPVRENQYSCTKSARRKKKMSILSHVNKGKKLLPYNSLVKREKQNNNEMCALIADLHTNTRSVESNK